MDTVRENGNHLLRIGLYTGPEAARLIGLSPATVKRWLDEGGNPLWSTDLGSWRGTVQLSFRDLIELRFVNQFRKERMSLQGIRWAYNRAREIVGDDRPFSTSRFRTDGRRIFLELKNVAEDDPALIDLKSDQYVLHRMVAPTFKDLVYIDEAVAAWWPLEGKKTVYIDPLHAFGQPILKEYGIPTATLWNAVKTAGSDKRVAQDYEIPVRFVRDAILFEQRIAA